MLLYLRYCYTLAGNLSSKLASLLGGEQSFTFPDSRFERACILALLHGTVLDILNVAGRTAGCPEDMAITCLLYPGAASKRSLLNLGTG